MTLVWNDVVIGERVSALSSLGASQSFKHQFSMTSEPAE
jgi:hypothetical protein